MKYLTGEEVLAIHNDVLDATGGAHGMRDVGLFLSVIEKPKTQFSSKELYKGVFVKAATYFDSLAKYHVFVDGNKRTALAVAARFLFLNGYEFVATNEEAEKFALDVVVERLETSIIADWLKNHSKKIK